MSSWRRTKRPGASKRLAHHAATWLLAGKGGEEPRTVLLLRRSSAAAQEVARRIASQVRTRVGVVAEQHLEVRRVGQSASAVKRGARTVLVVSVTWNDDLAPVFGGLLAPLEREPPKPRRSCPPTRRTDDEPEALAVVARAHFDRARELLGCPGAAYSQVAEAVLVHPAARAEFDAASALWWRMSLAVHRALRFVAASFAHARHVSVDDALQHAHLAAFLAAARFAEGPASFQTVARNAARHALAALPLSMVAPPPHSGWAHRAAGRLRAEARARGVELTDDEVSERVRASTDTRAAAGAALSGVASLDAPLEDGDGRTLGGTIAAAAWSPEGRIDARRLLRRMSALPHEERRVLFGLADGTTPVELARQLRMPTSQVRSLSQQAIFRLGARS